METILVYLPGIAVGTIAVAVLVLGLIVRSVAIAVSPDALSKG
jgi:hypothetical protein